MPHTCTFSCEYMYTTIELVLTQVRVVVVQEQVLVLVLVLAYQVYQTTSPVYLACQHQVRQVVRRVLVRRHREPLFPRFFHLPFQNARI